MATSKKDIIDTLLFLILWGRESNDEEMVQMCTRKVARMTGTPNLEVMLIEFESRKSKKRNNKVGT